MSSRTGATTHVPLSLTEDYCPSWGVWEGVRELIQNVHDGALESGGTTWSRMAVSVSQGESFACGNMASITYDRTRQRLVLINRSVGLQRRVLLLGSSQKADSLHAIGQFGEGMKVGNLALLREGRRVEMLTGDEHWHWTRRVDDAFGVRVLTVEVSDRSRAAVGFEGEAAAAAGLTEEKSEVDEDGDPAGAGASSNSCDDTVVIVEPIGADEWAAFSTRFLFLSPPNDSFRSAELGELLLDESLRGHLYVKGIWIADMQSEYSLGSGLNLRHLRLDRDRRAVVHASDLESQAAALWVRAIHARPPLAKYALELMRQPLPGADVRRVAEFLGPAHGLVADAIASEWHGLYGGDAIPVAQSELSRLSGSLYQLEQRLGKRLVVVNQQVLDVLGHASSVKSLEEELEMLAASESRRKQLQPTAVAWASLPESARQVARRVEAVLKAAAPGGTGASLSSAFDVSRLAIWDYGEGEFGKEEDEDEDQEGESKEVRTKGTGDAASSSSPSAAAAAAAMALPKKARVPLALFSIEAVHTRLGGCLRPKEAGSGGGGGCCCREVMLLRRVCRGAPKNQKAAAYDLNVLLSPSSSSSNVNQMLAGSKARTKSAADAARPSLLDRALQSLLGDRSLHALLSASFSHEGNDDAPPPPLDLTGFQWPDAAAECARRELLLRAELGVVESAAAAERSSSMAELHELHAEVGRLNKLMMQYEVDSVNAVSRARTQVRADLQVAAEQKRLEESTRRLAQEKAELQRQVDEMRDELKHSREARLATVEKAAAEREAHAVWQASMDEALQQCRRRLVARTEQIYQVGRLPSPPPAPRAPEGTNGGGASATTKVGAESDLAVLASIATVLREEREGGLCGVCVHAKPTRVLMPCRHELCGGCAAAVSEHSERCPLCMTRVASCADLRPLTCQICYEEKTALEGIECDGGGGGGGAGGRAGDEDEDGGGHFECNQCLAGHVTSAIDDESIDTFVQRGGVCCAHPGCRAPPFSDGTLAKALPSAIFTAYAKAKERVAEQRINAELERGFEERLQTIYARAGGVAPRESIKQHICERILTLSCPRCRQAFVDFDGCWALYCSRPGCGGGFCGICLEDCQGPDEPKAGHDKVHQHVNACPVLAQIGMQRFVHSEWQDWQDASRAAKGIRLREYLDTLPEAPRQHALKDCALELRDLGIDPVELGLTAG